MMSGSWARRDDPLCDRAVHGWRWTLHKDRAWIAANRRQIRLARIEREAREAAAAAEQLHAQETAGQSPASGPPAAPNSVSTPTA
jgi:hypothetical protein